MLLTPWSILFRRRPSGRPFCKRAWRQHHRNEPSVLHYFHTTERRDVIQEPAEIVLRVAR